MPPPGEEKIRDANGDAIEDTTKVELEAGTYAALLDRIDELETKDLKPTAQPDADDADHTLVDELADEANASTDIPEIAPPENLDSMSNSELVGFIVDVLNKQAGPRLKDMEVKYETIRVLREIDKAESKYNDFWRYESKIKEISMANPSLTIERAYHLAKAENPPPKGEPGETVNIKERSKTEKLLNLPARGAFGEKPGVASSSTSEVNRGLTLQKAAERAWDETVGKDTKT